MHFFSRYHAPAKNTGAIAQEMAVSADKHYTAQHWPLTEHSGCSSHQDINENLYDPIEYNIIGYLCGSHH